MAVPQKFIDPRATRRAGLRVAGTVLILLAIVAVIYGITTFSNVTPTPDDFNGLMADATTSGNSFTGIFMLGAGAVGMLIGFAMLTSSFNEREASAEVTAGTMCPACGILNEDGVDTCDMCGEPLGS